MKQIFLAVLCFSLFPRLVGADNTIPLPKELADLKSKYESDLQDVDKPVKDRYRDDLKQLLQQELLKGDVTATLAVRMEMVKADPDYPFTGQWAHRDSNGQSDVVRFSPNGIFVEEYLGGSGSSHWKVDAQHVATITKDGGSVFCHFRLNGAGHLQRSIPGSGDIEYIFEKANDE